MKKERMERRKKGRKNKRKEERIKGRKEEKKRYDTSEIHSLKLKISSIMHT